MRAEVTSVAKQPTNAPGRAAAGSEAVAMAAAVAFGQALRMGTQYDERRMGAIASSKGVLEGFA